MLTTVITVVHVLVAIGIVGLVLIQHGKGADAGAAFGAGAAGAVSGSVFGAKGSGNFLSRSTAILATMFFLTSLSLAYMSKSAHERPKTVMDTVPTETAQPKPDVAEKTGAEENADMPVVSKESTATEGAPATDQPAGASESASDMPQSSVPAATTNVESKPEAVEKSAPDAPKPAAQAPAAPATPKK